MREVVNGEIPEYQQEEKRKDKLDTQKVVTREKKNTRESKRINVER